MELDEKFLDATWTKDDNGKPQFFIINEAIISKLCILGDDCEPCFEGSQITKLEFSFNDGFKEQLFAMINEIKDLLKEGGAKEVFTRYAVEIGDALWSALYSHIEKTYPDGQNCYCSVYRIEGVFEEDGQKFAVLQNRSDMKYYRLDFALTEELGFVPSETLIEVTQSYTPVEEPQFALDAVEEYETEYAQKKKDEEEGEGEKCSKCGKPVDECECEKDDDEEKCSKCGKPLDECECEKKTYNLEEVVEYAELMDKFNALQADYDALSANYEAVKAEIEPLKQFKLEVEKKEKQAMIDQFYMLSDEDKADVIENIDTYSLDDIEAKLSIICVRNKVSFDLDENKGSNGSTTTFNLNSGDLDDDANIPAWVKSLRETAKTM
jgi:hypothetical protein